MPTVDPGRSVMGHRALVVYVRSDGRADVHYSHWGAGVDLARDLAPETPYGRPMAHRDDDRPIVEPDPIDVGVTVRTVLRDHLDFVQHEALYVVDPAFDVTEYRVLPYLIPTAADVIEGDERTGRGALVEVSAVDPGRGYVSGWYDGVRDALGALIDRGDLDEPMAFAILEDRLRRFAAVDRAVLFDPARSTDGDGDRNRF